MASVRVVTNETITVSAASTNNYITFKAPAGNISSISYVLRGTLAGAAKKLSQMDGMSCAFGRQKITFDGQVVFDQTQFNSADTTNSFQDIDVIRSVLNGSTEKGVQESRQRTASGTAIYGETHLPLMLTIGQEVNVNLIFDTVINTAWSDDDAAVVVADIMVNYVDNLSGTYSTRWLSRMDTLSTSGQAIKQIPTVDGYALEAIYLRSSDSSVAEEQFGDGSRISLQDLNGNVYLGERSGIEYGILSQTKWGSVPSPAENKTNIYDFVPAYPMTSLAGKILLDAKQMIGSAALHLTPSASVPDLDILCIYVKRNSANATAKKATQLTTSSESIGSGVEANPAIE